MKRILLGIITIGLISVFAIGATRAYFSDQGTSSGNTFATGTVDIEAGGETSLPVDFSDLAPGWENNGSLEVFNNGSLELRYAMITEPDTNEDGICGQLLVSIVNGSDTLYSGPLADAFFGNPAQGADNGDRILDASESEVLDFTFSLPLETDDDYQGTACVVNFVFDAEQTVNNP